MSTNNKKYVVGYEEGSVINLCECNDDGTYTHDRAIKQAKEYLNDNETDGEEYIIFELIPVKKFRYVQTSEIKEVPLK